MNRLFSVIYSESTNTHKGAKEKKVAGDGSFTHIQYKV